MHEHKAGSLTFVEKWNQRLLLPGGFSHHRGVWLGALRPVRLHTCYPSISVELLVRCLSSELSSVAGIPKALTSLKPLNISKNLVEIGKCVQEGC